MSSAAAPAAALADGPLGHLIAPDAPASVAAALGATADDTPRSSSGANGAHDEGQERTPGGVFANPDTATVPPQCRVVTRRRQLAAALPVTPQPGVAPHLPPAAARAAPARLRRAAATPLSASAARSAPARLHRAAAPPMPPTWLIGVHVLREFTTGLFGGVVVSTRVTRDYGRLWHVRYEDGDEEDLNWEELRPAIAGAEASGDAGAGAGAGAGTAAPAAGLGTSLGSDQQQGSEKAEGAEPSSWEEHNFMGVWRASSRPHGLGFRAGIFDGVAGGSGLRNLGSYARAEDAARSYDDAARALGRLEVNFPRPGSDEVQAGRGGTKRTRESASPTTRPSPHLKRLGAPARSSDGGVQRTAAANSADHAELMAADAAAAAPSAAPAAVDPGGGDMPAPEADDAEALALVATFLRGLRPPLSCLPACLAALPGSGASMAHLVHIAQRVEMPSANRQMLLDACCNALGITKAFDRVAFGGAVMGLTPDTPDGQDEAAQGIAASAL